MVAAYNGTNTITDTRTGVSTTVPWGQNGANLVEATWFGTSGATVSCIGTVTFTYTWVPQTRWIWVPKVGHENDPVPPPGVKGGSNPSGKYFFDKDQAPDEVKVRKNAHAGWNVPVTFGAGGPPSGSPDYIPATFTGTATTSPSGEYTFSSQMGGTHGSEIETKSGSSFTVTISLNASGTANPNSGVGGKIEASASCDVSVIPDQYGFQEISREDLGSGASPGSGRLSFYYIWKCTTGDLSNFPEDAKVYEHVAITGVGGTPDVDNTTGYPTEKHKNAPFDYISFNPIDAFIFPRQAEAGVGALIFSARVGECRDNFTRGRLIATPANGTADEGTITAVQDYRYVDSETSNPRIVRVASGTPSVHFILRQVRFIGNVLPAFRYTVSRDGLSSYLDFEGGTNY